eukprot:scaffold11583_cov54-Phaeocystis_antarctica.AAC.2
MTLRPPVGVLWSDGNMSCLPTRFARSIYRFARLGCGCGRRLVTGSCVNRETTQTGCPWSRPRVSLSIYLSIHLFYFNTLFCKLGARLDGSSASRPRPGARRWMLLCRPALVLALLAQSRLPRCAAITRSNHAAQQSPPPPPPPPPLIPLESGSPLCTREALTSLPVDARPVFVAIGGSNTQGANALSLNLRNGGTEYGPHVPSFASLLQRALGRGFATHMHADGGSGPSLAGTCTSRFIPPETRVGTVEFLPNIGYIKEDRRGTTLAQRVTIFARHHRCHSK